MLKTKLILFFLILCQEAYCQIHTISGYVENSFTGERIIGAYITDSISKSIAQTNNFGFYSIRIKEPDVILRATYVGSKSDSYFLHLYHDTLINIEIQPVRELNEVIITSSNYKQKVDSRLGLVTIPVSQLKSIPALGESDLIKSIQIQPGVISGVDGSTGLYIRGGGSGENNILLNDVPMYNVSHLYGFLSSFNISAMKDVKIYKSCFPAKYGGRVSSVIDVRSMDGNNRRIKGEFSIGLIASKLTIEGPLINSKTTFIISARRSYFNLYAGSLNNLNIDDLNIPDYHFYDLNIRIAHTFSQHDKVYLNLYSGKDEIRYKNENYISETTSVLISDLSKEISGWGNLVGSFQWNHVFSNNLFMNITTAHSRYSYNINHQGNRLKMDSVLNESTEEYYSGFYKSGISDIIVKADFEYSVSNNYKVNFGLGSTFHKFNPGSNGLIINDPETDIRIDTSYKNLSLYNNESFLYVESEMKKLQKLQLSTGLRISSLLATGESEINVEPRISANFMISPNLVIKAGYSRMVQYLNLLSTTGLSMPTDIWIPAMKGILPEKSDQVNIGISYDWKTKLFFSIEIYNKWLYNTADFKNGASLFSDLSPWYAKTTQGKGNAKGIEFMIEKQEGKLTGGINYSYSIANRKYADLNNGLRFPFKYDRRHNVNLTITHKLSDKWDYSILWTFGTGYPVTLPVEKYLPALNIVAHLQHNYIYYYPSLYNYRLPVYHRLDIGIHYKTGNKLFQHIFSLDIYNVYNRKNPVNMYYINNYSFQSIYLLPIIPSLTYTLKINDEEKKSKY